MVIEHDYTKTDSSQICADPLTRDAYVSGLTSVATLKALSVETLLSEYDKPIYVDVGCMNAAVVQKVHALYPDWTAIGLELNPAFLNDARKLPDIPEALASSPGSVLPLIQADASKTLPFQDSSVHLFSLFGLLPEIHPDHRVSLLQELRRSLKDDGKVLIRQAVKPEYPDEILTITLSRNNGENPDTEDGLKNTDLHALSTDALFKRFLIEYEFVDPRYKDDVFSRNEYKVPALLIAEFLRKRTFIQTKEHWLAEMKIVNSSISADDVVRMAKSAGFQPDEISVSPVLEDLYYGKIKPEEEIVIRNAQGEIVEQSARFPSHVYAFLTKFSHEQGNTFLQMLHGGVVRHELLEDFREGIPAQVALLQICSGFPKLKMISPAVFLIGRVYTQRTPEGFRKRDPWRRIVRQKVHEAGLIPLDGLAMDLHNKDVSAGAGRALFHDLIAPIAIVDGYGINGDASVEEAQFQLSLGGNVGLVVPPQNYHGIIAYLEGRNPTFPPGLPVYYGLFDLEKDDIIPGYDAIPEWLVEQRSKFRSKQFEHRLIKQTHLTLMTRYAVSYARERMEDMQTYTQILDRIIAEAKRNAISI